MMSFTKLFNNPNFSAKQKKKKKPECYQGQDIDTVEYMGQQGWICGKKGRRYTKCCKLVSYSGRLK